MFESWVLLISIPGVCVCPVSVNKVPNFILNVLIRVNVRIEPGIRRTEMYRKEKTDRNDKLREVSDMIRM